MNIFVIERGFSGAGVGSQPIADQSSVALACRPFSTQREAVSSVAILISGEPERPQAVRLAAEPHALELWGSGTLVESVAWWRLYRTNESSSTHHFRRVDRRQWELRVNAGGDRALLSHIGRRPIHRLLHPLRRLESLKIIFGVQFLLGRARARTAHLF